MALAPIIHFDCLAEDLPHGLHDWNTHILKIALTDAEPNHAIDTVISDIAELTTAGTYPTGGYTITRVSSGQTDGIYKLAIEDFTIEAVGDSIDPWRYAVLYNHTSSRLIAYWTYSPTLPINIAEGESYDFEFNPDTGIIPIYFVT